MKRSIEFPVKLSETDGESRFTLFVISAEGDLKPDERNPRRLISQDPGELRPQDPLEAKFSDRCPYSVEQANSGFKEAVEVNNAFLSGILNILSYHWFGVDHRYLLIFALKSC